MTRAVSVASWMAGAVLALAPLCVAAPDADRSGPAAGPFAVTVKAEAARFVVRIYSGQQVVDYQIYELAEARRLLRDAVARHGKMTVTLPTPRTGFDDGTSFPISSRRETADNDAKVILFYPIRTGFDYLACAREVNALVKEIKVPEKAHFGYHIEDMSLWVAEPEKSRPALLKQVADGVQAMSAALGGKVKFDISGLATPIEQRPVSETEVELSLSPVISLEVF